MMLGRIVKSCGTNSISTNRKIQKDKNCTTSRRTLAVSCSCDAAHNQKDTDRRAVLGQSLALLLASSQPLPALAAPSTNPFKKELKKRRQSVPESQYKEMGSTGLKYYDVIAGKGAEAKEGIRVVVHYEAKWKGVTFVTSRQGMGVTGGSPLGFDVGAKPGAGGTLAGLDLGVRGMRVGGRRLLKVPPQLAYGKKGYGEIPPNATVDFDVELLSVKTSAVGFKVKLVEG